MHSRLSPGGVTEPGPWLFAAASPQALFGCGSGLWQTSDGAVMRPL